jgi:hypothetical protein
MTQDSKSTETLTEQAYEFRLRLLKDEIAAQANTFDQIDSKTGVALGFTFVVVGQVLASLFRMATVQNQYVSLHPIITNYAFTFANLFAFLAFVSGTVSRWPRSFVHSVELTPEELDAPYLTILEGALKGFSEATQANDKINAKKSRWATRTYFFVGLSLTFYLVLTALLYWFSVTKR